MLGDFDQDFTVMRVVNSGTESKERRRSTLGRDFLRLLKNGEKLNGLTPG